MFYKLISIKTIARLISIIGMLAALAAITQLNIELYEDNIVEGTQISAIHFDKDCNRELADTIVDFIPSTNHIHYAHIMLHDDYAEYQEPTAPLQLRPPLKSQSLA